MSKSFLVCLAVPAILLARAAAADLPRVDIGRIDDQTAYHGYTRTSEVYSSEVGDGVLIAPDGAVLLENNTFALNDRAVAAIGAASVCAVNNIFAYNGIGVSAAPSSASSSAYNVFYGNTVDVEGALMSLTDLVVAPMFVDVLSLNFCTAPDSPLRDAGNPAPEYDDPDGTRNDIGVEGGPHGLRTCD